MTQGHRAPYRKQLMKKLYILTLASLCAWSTHAQGTFTFSNRVLAAGLDQPMYDIGGATKLTGPNFVAAIFLDGQQLGAAAPFRTGVGAGYWNPGEDSVRVVPGKFSGEIATGFTVEIWDSSKGPTARISYAAGGKASVSSPFSITLGGPKMDPSQPDDVPGVMLNFKGFALYPFFSTPEPSVIALGALGAFILAARQRRK